MQINTFLHIFHFYYMANGHVANDLYLNTNYCTCSELSSVALYFPPYLIMFIFFILDWAEHSSPKIMIIIYNNKPIPKDRAFAQNENLHGWE